MNRLVWIVVAAGVLLWSALCWFIAELVGTGGRAVVALTRWLGFEVGTTQFLADTLATIGGPARLVVWVAWAIGAGALLLVGSMASRVAREAAAASARAMEAQRGYARPGDVPGAEIEGEISDRRIGDPRR